MQNNQCRKRGLTLENSPLIQRTPKHRRLSLKIRSTGKKKVPNPNDPWVEGDDSIFGNILSQDLLEDDDEDPLNGNILDFDDDDEHENTICNKVLEEKEFCDDSIFNEIEEKTCVKELLEFNDTFEIPNDFKEEKVEDAFQGTEKFFDDIKIDFNESEFREFQCSQIVEGTSYETSEDIKQSQEFKIPPTPKGFSQICWQTQVFEEESKSKGIFVSQGPFYGLPEKVEKLIYTSKGIKSLYDWQQECLNLPAIHQRKNLIYALPTSGGKTLVAEILMLREIMCRKKNVLFVLPFVSIVQEKVSSMSLFALELDFLVEEYTAGKGRCPPAKKWKRNSIFISSIEKAAVLFDSLIDSKRAGEIGLIVIDEMHLIGEKSRGCTLESFLTKAMFINEGIQIVGMSATIGNLPDLSQFLNADVYTRNFRPVELKEYLKTGNDILLVDANNKNSVEECFSFYRTVDFKYNAQVQKVDPDHIAGMVSETAPQEGVLIFCSTRKNCENVAVLLSKVLPETKFKNHRTREKKDLLDALEKMCGVVGSILSQTIPFGIAYHHSGLTTDERKYIEYAYRMGVLSIICCTSTLAAGVNLPAKRVIIRAPYVGSSFMMLSQYKQMIGRAGRAGMGGSCGESFLICSSRDNLKVAQMLTSPMTKVLSSMNDENAIGLQSLILSAIGLEIANCRKDLVALAQTTLLSLQSDEIECESVETTVLAILKTMHKHSVWEFQGSKSNLDMSVFASAEQSLNTTQAKTKFALCNTTKIQLTKIGKAAFKAGVDFIKAKTVAIELRNSQKCMVLTNYSHILYLVVSFNSNANGSEMFQTNVNILYREYCKLDEGTKDLVKALGITEGHMIRMVKNISTKGPFELQLNRLYKTLIINEIVNLVPIHVVAQKFEIDRGMVQSLTNQCIVAASSIVRLCGQIDEFWCFLHLFERISSKLDKCGTVELEPLLELPAVKMSRARQLYTAGFKTIEDIAKVRPIDLSRSIEHLSHKMAKEIICAAKMILMKKLECLQEETSNIMGCLSLEQMLENI